MSTADDWRNDVKLRRAYRLGEPWAVRRVAQLAGREDQTKAVRRIPADLRGADRLDEGRVVVELH